MVRLGKRLCAKTPKSQIETKTVKIMHVGNGKLTGNGGGGTALY